jgi:hypothetical protein
MKVWVARRVRDGALVFETPSHMVINGLECDAFVEAAVSALVRDGSHGWITVGRGWLQLQEVTAA